MQRLPIVAIVGRPNTGKSTLFNRLVGHRLAIESDIAGTTRDHIASKVQEDEMDYLLLDTGGMGGGSTDKQFEDDVAEQSMLAVTHADLILMTVNSRDELTASDHEVVRILRTKRKRHVPVLVIVTKCDTQKHQNDARDAFHELGIGEEIIPLSSIQNIGIGRLREAILEQLEKLQFEKKAIVKQPVVNEFDVAKNDEAAESHGSPVPNEIPRIAIVGKPNVGKSSIINALMPEPDRKRSGRLVSPIPGTTRDVTDSTITSDGKEYIFVDTAGLRRQAVREGEIEALAAMRSIQALEYCDIAVLVIDALEPISQQDKRIAGMIVDAGKGLIIALNKMDLLTAEQKAVRKKDLTFGLPFCRFAPVLPCSAVTREGLRKLYPTIDMVQRNRVRRIPTKDLHRWLQDAGQDHPLGETGTTKHIMQTEDIPPTFALFLKNPKQVKVSQLRYLDNQLRKTFGFEGSPIRWVTKATEGRGKKKDKS